MPEAKLFLTGRSYSIPDFSCRHFPEVAEVGPYPELGQTDQRPGNKDQKDPGRDHLCKAAQLFKAQNRQQRKQCAQNEADNNPQNTVRENII